MNLKNNVHKVRILDLCTKLCLSFLFSLCLSLVTVADDCCLVSDSTQRSLLSVDVPTCVVPRTLSSYGDRTFAAAAARLWNSVPVQLRNPEITYERFKRQPFGEP